MKVRAAPVEDMNAPFMGVDFIRKAMPKGSVLSASTIRAVCSAAGLDTPCASGASADMNCTLIGTGEDLFKAVAAPSGVSGDVRDTFRDACLYTGGKEAAGQFCGTMSGSIAVKVNYYYCYLYNYYYYYYYYYYDHYYHYYHYYHN